MLLLIEQRGQGEGKKGDNVSEERDFFSYPGDITQE
jgi:hypothetical protein